MAILNNLFLQTHIIPFSFFTFFSRSRTPQALLTLFIALALFFFFFFPASATTPTSRLRAASIFVSSLSSIISSNTHFASSSKNTCTDAASITPVQESQEAFTSCNIFDGTWVVDDSNSYPFYKPGSCPFVDDSFNCFKNGRPDSGYFRLRWKPHGCHIPRFDGLKMLEMLRGKRMVFVGDSLNRNMWESLVCTLRESLFNKNRVFEVSGRRKFNTRGFFSYRFKDYECSIDFIKSPFLVQEWRIFDQAGTRRETLRLDMIQGSSVKYKDADIIIFNTGHWWTHHKTYKGNNYFQEGTKVYTRLEVEDAYTKALKTWSKWVDSNINTNQTKVFFMGYSASHFKGGPWNSGGSCNGEMRPITNGTYVPPSHPWMMSVVESVITKMKTRVIYLNITKMTDYRKDGHPSIFRQAKGEKWQTGGGMIQDCSHWCLPGVPDSWNELLYTNLLMSQNSLV